ncbi:MAG: aconitase X catalytic domain-containing protein [Thermoplasmata archaeon]|nr:aconitase X catalytic domain-containing protein [Thermoplasmata archaeon]
MLLTREEEAILAGEHGEVPERMLRLLVRLGEIYKADKMIPVSSAQVAGVSYKSIGDPGLEFLEDIAGKGARVSVLTFLNPAGMDIESWKELGFPEDFVEKQLRIIEAFKKMGIVISATCTPYLSGNLPRFREHVAWSESSAVSFANSVLGARTNREGGPSALAAAILGRTPNYGFHLDENRKPDMHVAVNVELRTDADFGALGYFVGKIVKDRVPYFTGIKHAGVDSLKALGAAMAASGAVALYHAHGLTPEAKDYSPEGLDTISFGEKELTETYQNLNSGEEPDILILGCPHSSLNEIRTVAMLVEGKRLRKPMWVCTSRAVKELAIRMGYDEIIRSAGGKIVADTCTVVAPVEEMGFKTIAVNSGKAANYLPGFCKARVIFGDTEGLIRRVIE